MVETQRMLYWNPGAISYLVELLLAVLLSTYVVHRLILEHRGKGISAPTLLFGSTFWFLVPGLWSSLLHALTGGGWTTYAMPWLLPGSLDVQAMPWVTTFTGISAVAFVQFAYRFPAWLPGSQSEARVVGTIMALCVCVEIAASAYTDWTLVHDRIWFRPDWTAVWTSASMLWAVVVFTRQLASAQSVSRRMGIVAAVRALRGPAVSRQARAAQGFIALSLLPAAHTVALVLQADGLLGAMSMDILISWSVLAQLTGLTLVFFSHLPERSSFLFKLTTISILLLFAVINGACWVLSPPYVAQFRAPVIPQARTAVQFTPQGGGGYVAAGETFVPVSGSGNVVGRRGTVAALPFVFPFYGTAYRQVYVAAHGSIGFERMPQILDATLGYGTQPAIEPLLMRSSAAGSLITSRVEHDRLVVTRRDGCSGSDRRNCYAVQTILHADGRVVLQYPSMPIAPEFGMFDPLAAPWVTGITPGSQKRGQQPVMQDHYRAFMAYLDRLYAPIVSYIVWTTLAVLLGIPLLFQGFLVRPLTRLLRGMRQFRDGDLAMQVTVTFNDEIGYLTDSFNEMARGQNVLVNTLEEQVALRSAQLATFAARNARLEERNRLSGDLHDTVTQTLFSAAMLSEGLAEHWRRDPGAGAERLAQVEQMNRLALTEMRTMLTDLRNEGIVEQPLAQLITALAIEFSSAQGDRTEVHCDISGDTVLPLDVQAVMFRIAQESLNNIAHHAAASQIDITLEVLPGQAMLTISDNGKGFDPWRVPEGHLGLEIMRERAKRINAVLEIETRPGAGTHITAIWMQQD